MPITLECSHIIEFLKNTLYFYYYKYNSVNDENNPLVTFIRHYLFKNKFKFWELDEGLDGNIFNIFRDRFINKYDKPINANHKLTILRFMIDFVPIQLFSEIIPAIYFDQVLKSYTSEHIQKFSKIKYEQIFYILNTKIETRIFTNPTPLGCTIDYFYDATLESSNTELSGGTTYYPQLQPFTRPSNKRKLSETVTTEEAGQFNENLVKPISKIIKLSDDIRLDQQPYKNVENPISKIIKSNNEIMLNPQHTNNIINHSKNNDQRNSAIIDSTLNTFHQQNLIFDDDQIGLDCFIEPRDTRIDNSIDKSLIDHSNRNIVSINAIKPCTNTNLQQSDQKGESSINKDDNSLREELEKVISNWFNKRQ